MYRLTSQLIIYRSIDKDSILFRLADICRRFREEDYNKEELVSDILDQINRLLRLSTDYGFDRNLWHDYLAFLLAMTETPFTLVSEKVGRTEGSVNHFARHDFRVFRQLFDYDFTEIEKLLDVDCFTTIQNYTAVGKSEQIFNKNVSDKVRALSDAIDASKDVDEMYRIIMDFYLNYGVGMFGLNKAFRLAPESERLLTPITATNNVLLSDLIGYDRQKAALIENTEAFIAGRKANNVLLYGDAGTGKSTSIKAILNHYYDQGLRIIEIFKHEFKYLARLISQIRNRNYRFIIYMDDLSFEDFETEYKYLKAVIEGGLELRPDNVLIYATSNRRHLIRETWTDRYDQSAEDIHRNDTVQEKLSLAGRFGVTIGFFRPSHDEYHEIVRVLADAEPEITMDDKELFREADRWALRHGGVSGRTARQFVDYLAGTLPLNAE